MVKYSVTDLLLRYVNQCWLSKRTNLHIQIVQFYKEMYRRTFELKTIYFYFQSNTILMKYF